MPPGIPLREPGSQDRAGTQAQPVGHLWKKERTPGWLSSAKAPEKQQPTLTLQPHGGQQPQD